MKKLILTAAIAMSIVVANGAACTWGVTGAATASIKNGTTTWTSAGTNPVAYLFLASDTAAVEAALAKGSMDTSLAVGSTSAFNTRGRFSGVSVDLSTESLSYNMVLVYTDATDANKIWYQIASTPVTASGSDDSSTPAVPAQFGTGLFNSSNWSSGTASVPEPTSGLLLLLGVAGLALKRKCA